jgi:hypothetical protein
MIPETAITHQVNGGLTMLSAIATSRAPFAVVVLLVIASTNFTISISVLQIPTNGSVP